MVVTAAALIRLASGRALRVWAVGCSPSARRVRGLFLRRAVEFARDRTDRKARKVLHASLFYLPGVFALLMIDALLLKYMISRLFPFTLLFAIGVARLTRAHPPRSLSNRTSTTRW